MVFRLVPRGGSKTPNSMRRYVIGEVFGSANVLCSFTAISNIPDNHEVRDRRWQAQIIMWTPLPVVAAQVPAIPHCCQISVEP